MLDKLPAPARHFLIAVLGAFIGVFAAAIGSAHGVFGVDWTGTLKDAIDTAAVTGVSAMTALYILPITKQYGIGAVKKSKV
jgi:hypothetical protein